MFAQNQISNVVNNLKTALFQKEGKVETDGIEEFLQGFGQLGAACQVCGIVIKDDLGAVNYDLFPALIERLKMHGILIITMQFPDGDEFELVTRYNERQQKIHTFGYKV